MIGINVDRKEVVISEKSINNYAQAFVDSNFEQRLIENIKPISQHYLAACLHHMFATGIFDELTQQEHAIPIASLAMIIISLLKDYASKNLSRSSCGRAMT